MRSIIVALVLFLLAPSLASAKDPSDSVYPLQMAVVVAEAETVTDGAPASAVLVNMCVVTSINEKEHRWLTAEHCVRDDAPRYIMGDQVRVEMRDVINDIAILKTPRASAPAMHLALQSPGVRDYICMTGYPLGWVKPVTTAGIVSAIDMPGDSPDDPHTTVFNITGAKGSSGSAVRNVADEIVSVLTWGYGNPMSFSGIMGGVPFDVLEKYRSYWE